MNIRQAHFALRIVQRHTGIAAIIYRRTLNAQHQERLTRTAAISPLAFTAGKMLLLDAVRATEGAGAALSTGAFHRLNEEWGPRVACYALVVAGLRNPERLSRVAFNLMHADGAEAAWWLGLMTQHNGRRAIRALRILLEAVK